MMLTLSTFVKERFSMFTQTCMSVLGLYEPGTVSMLRILNWALTRENHRFRPPSVIKHTYAAIEWVIWVLVKLKLS